MTTASHSPPSRLTVAAELLLVGSLAVVAGCSTEAPPPSVQNSPPVEPRFERRVPRYFAGLDEHATIVKSELSIRVERADGRVQMLEQVEREEGLAWSSRHGSATGSLVDRMAQAAPDEQVRFAITFDSLAGQDDLAERLLSDEEDVASAARAEHAARISQMGGALRELAVAHGVSVTGAAVYAPFLFAEGTPAQIEAVAQLDGAASLLDDPVGDAVDHATSPYNVHNVLAYGAGTTGTDRRVGIIEPGKCRIRSTHMLVDAPTTYKNTSAGTCVSAAECDSQCGTPGDLPHACVSFKCRDGHGTAVASIVGQMMPDALLFYYNDATQTDEICSLQKLAAAFDFFLANQVKVVNQSFGCGTLSDGAIQDYHARVNDVFVTKSAGNANASSFATDVDSACDGTKNSMCVGATTSDSEKRSCYSVWRNPSWLISNDDREEPDVMGFGGEHPPGIPGTGHYECDGVAVDQVQVATTATDTFVAGSQGTSFAAPAVAALASLTEEFCVEQTGYDPNALTLRSWIRTSAFSDNPVGWKYSTLQHVFPSSVTVQVRT